MMRRSAPLPPPPAATPLPSLEIRIAIAAVVVVVTALGINRLLQWWHGRPNSEGRSVEVLEVEPPTAPSSPEGPTTQPRHRHKRLRERVERVGERAREWAASSAEIAHRLSERAHVRERAREWAASSAEIAHRISERAHVLSERAQERAHVLSERARSPGRSLLRQGFNRRRSASASPQRQSDGKVSGLLGARELRRLRMPRAISPPTLHVRANFGQHLASALGERSAVRLARHMTMDGSPRKAKPTAEEKKRLRRTLPKGHTSAEASEIAAIESQLPSDARPWDRLHVWLVDGEGLPYRPRLWPFEPYVVVTAIGEDTGSTSDSPIGAFEFQVRASHMSPTHPVWDEQGLLCYNRHGTTHFRVVICGSGKVWNGIFGAYVLRPRALAQVMLSYSVRWVQALCLAPLRMTRAVASAVRGWVRPTAGAATAAAAAAAPLTDRSPSSEVMPVAVTDAAGQSRDASPPAMADAPAAADRSPSATRLSPSPHDVSPDGLYVVAPGGGEALAASSSSSSSSYYSSVPTLQERMQRELIEKQTFPLPPAGEPWHDVCVPLPPRCGGMIRLRVRVTAWEERLVHPPPTLLAQTAMQPPAEPVGGAEADGDDGPTGEAGAVAVTAAEADAQPRDPSPHLKWLNVSRDGDANHHGAAARANANANANGANNGGGTPHQPHGDAAADEGWLGEGMEHRVLAGSGCGGADRAVLSFYTHPELSSGGSALLWMPGRNDAFFHPHVASALASHGIDVYVLSYRRMGVCRKLGVLDDPMRNSHCASGRFQEYHEDVQQALAFLNDRKPYAKVLGYCHSTGCPVLLDYVMAHGDAAFAGFIFNSPFLDWGMAGRPLSKLVVMRLPELFFRLRLWTNDTELLGGGGASAWALQTWSQYRFDPACRPLYTVPVTIGFCRGINATHAELRRRSRAGEAITRKPFLVFTSMHDDVLEGDELAVAAHAIGPSRTLIQMCHARHDVFVSAEPSVVEQALASLRMWLVSQGFPPTK